MKTIVRVFSVRLSEYVVSGARLKASPMPGLIIVPTKAISIIVGLLSLPALEGVIHFEGFSATKEGISLDTCDLVEEMVIIVLVLVL